ncbi:hypothetical protein [Mesorhizobium sp. CN2-181]|uniref:hypothetical protein n=1 Tax=Mesorhizobium yinganensis TaxID=3157707 RepID=UPI0032B7DAF9
MGTKFAKSPALENVRERREKSAIARARLVHSFGEKSRNSAPFQALPFGAENVVFESTGGGKAPEIQHSPGASGSPEPAGRPPAHAVSPALQFRERVASPIYGTLAPGYLTVPALHYIKSIGLPLPPDDIASAHAAAFLIGVCAMLIADIPLEVVVRWVKPKAPAE